MILVNNRNEWLANKLVTAASDRMFAGVVAGNNPGKVWADNDVNPSSALVWSDGLEGFNFMGSADNTAFNQSLEALIDQEIIPFLKSNEVNYFEYTVDSEDWYAAINPAIGSRGISESYQYVYKSDENTKGTFPASMKEPFRAVEIDEAFYRELQKGEINNSMFLMNYVEQYWGTFDNYLGKGYGYAALTDSHAIASLAISSAVYQSTHTIGVETLEDYKRIGLSSSLVRLLLHKFKQNQIASWWDCMESNIASQKTAEKAGLYKAYRYKVNWFKF